MCQVCYLFHTSYSKGFSLMKIFLLPIKQCCDFCPSVQNLNFECSCFDDNSKVNTIFIVILLKLFFKKSGYSFSTISPNWDSQCTDYIHQTSQVLQESLLSNLSSIKFGGVFKSYNIIRDFYYPKVILNSEHTQFLISWSNSQVLIQFSKHLNFGPLTKFCPISLIVSSSWIL